MQIYFNRSCRPTISEYFTVWMDRIHQEAICILCECMIPIFFCSSWIIKQKHSFANTGH